jgi:hypothetical protein
VNCTLGGVIIKEDALNLQQELMALFGRGSFLLRKVCLGHRSILEAVPPVCREMEVPILLDRDKANKTLGLQWNPLPEPLKFIKGTYIETCESLKIVVKILFHLLLMLYLTDLA